MTRQVQWRSPRKHAGKRAAVCGSRAERTLHSLAEQLLKAAMSDKDQNKTDYPMFSTHGDGYLKVNSMIVVGEAGTIGTVSGTGRLIIDNGFVRGTVPGELVVFDAPDGKLSDMSVMDMEARIAAITAVLDNVDAINSEPFDLTAADFRRECSERLERAQCLFDTVRLEVLDVCEELYSRVNPIERRPLAVHIRCGIDAVRFSHLCGYKPASGIADFLKFLMTARNHNQATAEKFLRSVHEYSRYNLGGRLALGSEE